MANCKFVLNRAGVRELLKSEEMLEICREHAKDVQQRAGEGFVAEDRHYPSRNGVAVRADSPEAYNRNMKHNTLLKALGGSK